MVRVIDARHLLDDHGNLPLEPARLRRLALWMARLIEYGGPVPQGELRETLVECGLRPGRKPCPGLLWVEKTERDEIVAFCLICQTKQAVIHDWQGTEWAEGPMEPAPRDLVFETPESAASGTVEASRAPVPSADTVHELRVTLREIDPPIWRSLTVPSNSTLPRVHRLLNAAMGWQNYHLHEFVVGDRRYAARDPEWPDDKLLPERGVRLLQVAPGVGARFVYRYDFGDDWEHEVVVTRILPKAGAGEVPACTGGARACPPEDAGGPWGYAEKLRILRNRKHPQHGEIQRWFGVRFDPDVFDPREASRRVRKVR